MAQFVLIKDGSGRLMWRKKVGDRLYNHNNGWCTFDHIEEKIYDEVEAEDFPYLDWKKSGLCDIRSSGNYGWLTPDGIYYHCEYQEHMIVAAFIFNRLERSLEVSGWVKLNPECLNGWHCEQRLTAEQRNWLSLNGFLIDDYD
jgi:hypothetical protein